MITPIYRNFEKNRIILYKDMHMDRIESINKLKNATKQSDKVKIIIRRKKNKKINEMT